MSSNLVRKPVRMIPENQELLKGLGTESTDYTPAEEVPQAYMVPQYRTPSGRENGNTIFRRYPDGILDVSYAAGKVVDCIHLFMAGSPLNYEQKVTLSVCYPAMFQFIGAGMSDHMMISVLKITPAECMAVCYKVSEILEHEMRYQATLCGR